MLAAGDCGVMIMQAKREAGSCDVFASKLHVSYGCVDRFKVASQDNIFAQSVCDGDGPGDIRGVSGPRRQDLKPHISFEDSDNV